MPQWIHKRMVLHTNIEPFWLFWRRHTLEYCGLTSHIISMNSPRNLMNIILSLRIFECRNAPVTSKVTMSLPSCTSTTRAGNNASSNTIGAATASPSFRYLRCLLSLERVLPLIRQYILSLIKLTAYIVLVISPLLLIILDQLFELMVYLTYHIFPID